MNVVFETENFTIVDDREFITASQAIEILLSGKSISVCDPPDYGAENDFEVHTMPFTINIIDIVGDKWITKSKEEIETIIFEYLRSYEISR